MNNKNDKPTAMYLSETWLSSDCVFKEVNYPDIKNEPQRAQIIATVLLIKFLKP